MACRKDGGKKGDGRSRWRLYLRPVGVALALAIVCLAVGRETKGDGTAQVTTSKSIPQATVEVIDPESGSSSGGGNTDVKVAPGDIILFRIHFTAIPDKVTHGIQGYLTEFIPPNTEVVGVRIIDENGLTLPPKYPGISPDDCGASCNGFDSVPCDSAYSFCSGGSRNLADGSISQVYADTGIFFTTDPRLIRVPDYEFLTLQNGVLMDPSPRSVDRMATIIGASKPYYSHTEWDFSQVLAYGAQGAACGGQGTGNTPYLYGSPVAGPDTFYIYEATEPSPGVIQFNDVMGPWERVSYPGSLIGVGSPASGSAGPLARAISDTSLGWDLTPNNPLPSGPGGTTAVRLALGEVRVGQPGAVEIALRVLDTPLDPNQSRDVNCAEVFAGETAGDPAKDNLWPFYLASPGCAYLNLKFDIDVDQVLAITGDILTYTLTGKNLSLNPQHNVVIKQKFDSTDVAFVSATDGGTLVTNCDGDGFDCVIWPTMDLQPSDEYVFYTTFDVGGGGHLAAPMYANYQSSELPAPGFTTEAITVIKQIAVVKAQLGCDTASASPGGTARLSGALTNGGTAAANWESLTIVLPAGWTIVDGSVLLGGAVLSCSSTSTNTPVCNMGSSFDPGESKSLQLDVDVPPGEPAGLYDVDLQIWASQPGFGPAFESYFADAATVPVGAPRSDPPVIDCPIAANAPSVSGSTTEADGTVIRLYLNGLQRDSGSSAAGIWELSGYGATFGELYNGVEVRATAQAPGELESPLSDACFATSVYLCFDGVDNDGDGLTDFPADPGCDSAYDGSEEDPPPPQCSDGIDNDSNGLIDYPNDPACSSADDTTENGAIACSDGIDNDGDGLIDYPNDLGCSSAGDPNEIDLAQCQDGVDNDGDGHIDFPADPGCHSDFDDDEVDYTDPDDALDARLLIVFDTSGSMNWNTCDSTFTGGDGSAECPGQDVDCSVCSAGGCSDGLPNDSRIYKVKKGISDAVTAYGSVEWALMRFHQRGVEFQCPGENASLGSGGWQGSGTSPCGGGFDSGDLLVGFGPENLWDLLAWMDLDSNYPGTPPPGMDWELRGSGTTPLAGSLASAHSYLLDAQLADSKLACREYRVILVTDGAETCGGDPSAAAASLFGDGIKVHVVGFATADSEIITNLDSIAVSGGTSSAVFADDEAALSAAIGSIVSDSIIVEACNDWDDDCDGLVDEDFPRKGMVCDDGEKGICLGTGTYVCSADGTTTVCQITDPGETATTETCNGLDDDCNGIIDDVEGGCAEPPPELCNGVDDDGDGLIDNNLDDPLLGQPCGSDLGECELGTTVCQDGSVVCEQPYGPEPESCDALDNDCDGMTDESLARPCYEHHSGYPEGCVYDSFTDTWSCVGACSTGIQVCSAGVWGACQGYVWEQDEVCNDVDDDCDGSTDESLTRLCQESNTYGTCTGDETCAAGVWTGCTAQTPTEEVCDGQDNDCDGVTDQITRQCYGSTDGCTYDAGTETWSCVGQCHTGSELCTSGAWGGCTGERGPAAELCNALDDDCDGQTDEDENGGPLSEVCYSGPSGTAGVGECSSGIRTCGNGSWSGCVGEAVPTVETCNALDDDCDGLTDEGLGQTTCGLGVCEHTVDNCSSGALQTCDPYEGASAETCNGLDDDCNGVADGLAEVCYTFASGCTYDAGSDSWACVGACAPGVRQCPPPSQGGTGSWLACEYQQGPVAEVCDGLDNDCDGMTDEDENGDPLTEECYPPGSGSDTGCTLDATTMSWTCEGICQAGHRVCTSAQWEPCAGEVTPALETCNALDDDCDGLTDEPEDMPGLGQPCGVALGRCVPGTLQCIDGQEVCEGGEGPFDGVCNGLDDDCDGAIDEWDEVADEEGLDCGESEGECEPGQTQCVGGGIICEGGVQPSEEVCDGLDNDCDGLTDDGAECPADSYCVEGACRPVCDPGDEFACPPHQDCQNVWLEEQEIYVCLPADDCGGETCPDGWVCVDEQCVDPCEGVQCEEWEMCQQGVCVDQSCSGMGIGCPPGELCIDHECVADPCLEAGCGPEESCVKECQDGTCTSRCEPLCVCIPGERCDPQGNCVEDLCYEVGCAEGKRCDPLTGECETDPCHEIDCVDGEACFEGSCVEDPCEMTVCPPYYECYLIPGTESGSVAQAQCRLDTQYWMPGSDEVEVMAGGSGCSCRSVYGAASTDEASTPLERLGYVALIVVVLFGAARAKRWYQDLRARRVEASKPPTGESQTEGKSSGRPTRRFSSGLSTSGVLMGALAFLGLLFLLAMALSGCAVDGYDFSQEGYWDVPDAEPDSQVILPDANDTDGCAAGQEVCDGVDNDCDLEVDEGFDLQTDTRNCGQCGKVCDYENAFPECVGGECAMGECLPGFWDINQDPSDGCEYNCLLTNAGAETCDGVDNDCNGETDETFDLMTDPANCGQCHRVCVFFEGTGACVGGDCVLARCNPGYVDKDGNPDNGCECMVDVTEDQQGDLCAPADPAACPASYACVDRDQDGQFHCSPFPSDECNGIDDDCDGDTDEDAPIGEACYTHPTGCRYEESTQSWTCFGECATGNMGCVGGEIRCAQQVGPAGEACDGLDNDCDGYTDEDFDFQNDPSTCGGCNTSCTEANVPNAVPGCEQGSCVVVVCLPGFYDLNGSPSDGCEYSCSLSNGGVEACGDNLDNDCDGQTDEGFDLQTDPSNCGTCGYVCQLPNATVDCVSGGCVLTGCVQGYWNANGDDSDGCEYACTRTNGGTEICDDLDNDCDGVIDDGFDKLTDVQNCGTCGHACSDYVPAGAQVVGCANGQCSYECMSGHHDLNGDLAYGASGDGCEYACVVSNMGVEACDGADNDCDGSTDEDSGGAPLTQPCYEGPAGTEDVGICHGGTATCTGGSWGSCVGQVTPEPYEQCDSMDHDCDGDDLNGFDLTSDILNCGGCGVSCFDSAPANAYATECVSSQCVYSCDAGYFNVNSDWSDGCEYPCEQTTPPGSEYCDGVDNDCDALTDESSDLIPPPSDYCRTDAGTPCAGTTAACTDGVLGIAWYCQYAAGVETDPTNPNRVLVQESLCDEIDGNCDGYVDEIFVQKGDPCDDGELGECLGTGVYACNLTKDGLTCELSDPGADPVAEECNGLDDDCDGDTDEAAPDTMVHIQTATMDFWIDAYEASRPDADADSAGVMTHRSCSNPDVMPWYHVTWEDAAAACAAAGKRLCTEAEWQEACQGPLVLTYPYGDIYEPESCNGADYDHDCTLPDNDEALPTGTSYGCPPPADTLCISDWSVIDMSGNLMEWTATQVSSSPVYYRIRGGAYNNVEGALTCQFAFFSAEPTFHYEDLGFRCCADTLPW